MLVKAIIVAQKQKSVENIEVACKGKTIDQSAF